MALSSVEELHKKIEEKVSLAKQNGSVESLLTVVDEVAGLLAHFIDTNRDKIDNSLIDDSKKDIERLRDSKKDLEHSLAEAKQKEEKFSAEYGELKTEIEKEKDSNRDAEKAVFRIMAESQEVRSKLAVLKAGEETLRIVQEDFKRELTELAMLLGPAVLHFSQQGSSLLNEVEVRGVQEDRRRVMEKLKIRIEDSGGAGGAEVQKEYSEATDRDMFLEKELTDLKNSATSLSELISDLDVRLSTEFKVGIEKINTQFKEFFALMFGGGHAELKVTTEQKRSKKNMDFLLGEDNSAEGDLTLGEATTADTDAGIDIDVNLPKKKVKGLMMLSGGERALTSIALLFAISQVNPPPFIILDETDAALDEANSKKYADMVENLSKHSQLIVITHNRETMSRAGILYGVTMGMGGGSKLLSVAFDEAIQVAK